MSKPGEVEVTDTTTTEMIVSMSMDVTLTPKGWLALAELLGVANYGPPELKTLHDNILIAIEGRST